MLLMNKSCHIVVYITKHNKNCPKIINGDAEMSALYSLKSQISYVKKWSRLISKIMVKDETPLKNIWKRGEADPSIAFKKYMIPTGIYLQNI